MFLISNFLAAVPDYAVVHPYQVDHDGNFLTHELSFARIRSRRDTTKDSHDVHYKVKAFDKHLHLKLKENKKLLSPNFKVEVIGHNGKVLKTHKIKNCHYTGTVKSHKRSKVAISNCRGLVSKHIVLCL